MYYMLLATLNKCLVGQQYSELCFITVNVHNLVNRSTVVLRKCTTLNKVVRSFFDYQKCSDINAII